MKATSARFERINEPQKRRQRAITEKDIKSIRVGDRFDYRGRGTITFGALYSAEVIAVSPHTITLFIVIDQASAHIERYGAAAGYRVSIQKSEIGRTERLYEQRRWD